ncbi:hypothetical protein [Paraburkholderia caffeinitolerans]|uniref:hypothetical protein n=1 Tax=Paraburkholderia caffeinitolerans TaxID=1723730 RepID=UPI0015833CD0|nr:hypothetical protein [Paraburkholderia caffeinitolerans]
MLQLPLCQSLVISAILKGVSQHMFLFFYNIQQKTTAEHAAATMRVVNSKARK